MFKLLILLLLISPQAVADTVRGEVGVILLSNVLDLTADNAREVCERDIGRNNCDIVIETYDMADGFYEIGDDLTIYVPINNTNFE